MSHSLEIIWDKEITSDTVHRFRNFGEDVWREFQDELTLSLDEIDRSTDRFIVKNIKSHQLKRILKRLEKIATAHLLFHELDIKSRKD